MRPERHQSRHGVEELDWGNAEWPDEDEIAAEVAKLLKRKVVGVEFVDRGELLSEGIYGVSTYEIVCRRDDGNDAQGWSTDEIGPENEFADEEEARTALEGLLDGNKHDPDWREARYGIRKMGTWPVTEIDL